MNLFDIRYVHSKKLPQNSDNSNNAFNCKCQGQNLKMSKLKVEISAFHFLVVSLKKLELDYKVKKIWNEVNLWL